MTDTETIKRLGLYVPEESEYIPIEEVTVDNMSAHFYQTQYKQALVIIDQQLEHIKKLEEMNK